MPIAKHAVQGPNLQRDTLRKIVQSPSASPLQRELAMLKIAYSEDHKLLTGYIHQLSGKQRIYPRFNPAQASGRTSTTDPPLTNFPRQCINPACQEHALHEVLTAYNLTLMHYVEHEWTDQCWSARDCLSADHDEVLVTHDHDDIEGRIYALVLDDQSALQAYAEGIDRHTLTACDMFHLPYPTNQQNPHTSPEDEQWRTTTKWQGKDTRMRVLAKNFRHGSKFTETWKFVYVIKGIEQYGISHAELGELARQYIALQGDVWDRKLVLMQQIRNRREARSLYGFRRIFFDGSPETGRRGIAHMISSTVSDYNNHTLHLLQEWLGKAMRLLHNAHDGDKIAVSRQWLHEHYPSPEGGLEAFKQDYRSVIERPMEYHGRSMLLTAGVKIYL